jgi:putative peptidoglycan lipid II flippase
MGRLRDTVHSSLRLAACVTFPATAGLILFRREIVRLLYERGSFLGTDTDQTSMAVLYYSLALFAYSAVKILVPAFYALGDTRTPVRSSVTSVAAKVGLTLGLILRMGFLGLALATAIASWINFALLVRQLDQATGGRLQARQVAAYARIAAASVAVGAAAELAFRAGRWILPGPGAIPDFLHLGLAITTGVTVTVPMLGLFGVGEAHELIDLLKHRIFGR